MSSATVPIALLLLVAPGAFAAKSVVMSAPYTGVTTSTSNGWASSTCGHATISTKAFFHPGSGMGGFADRAAAYQCSSRTGSTGSSDGSFFTAIPITLSHSPSTIVAATIVRAWVSAIVTSGNCTLNYSANAYMYCGQSASARIHGHVYLEDTTTGARWYSSTTWAGLYRANDQDVLCYQGGCSTYQSHVGGPSQVSSSASWWFSATRVNTKDSFALVFAFSGAASASSWVHGTTLIGGGESAVVNAATRGNGIDIASITIS